MKFLTFIASILCVSITFGAEVFVKDFRENILFSGRWEHTQKYSSASAPAVMLQFNANAKTLSFDIEGEAKFSLFEDDNEILTFVTNERKTITANVAGDNTFHNYRLVKISESNSSEIRVYKIATDKKFGKKPKSSNRRIEFIGDSFTVGFGNLGKNGDDESDVFDKTDASKSYAYLLANSYKADFQINAFSGRGLIRNYNNIVPNWTISKLYDYTIPGTIEQRNANKSLWNFNEFHPQVIVIFVGINDFQGAPPYANKDSLKKAYINFLDKLRDAHKGVKFLLVSTKVWPNDDLTPTIKSIYESEIKRKKNDLEFICVQTNNVGLLGHPDIYSHIELANKLRPIIGRLANWLHR